MKTEKEMQIGKVPVPETLDDLKEFVEGVVKQEHTYGTAAYALSHAAVAAFNYVAHELGVTGFQAGCASMDILKRLKNIDCPFVIIRAESELYPQYDNAKILEEAQIEWEDWVKKAAIEKLEEDCGFACDKVRNHWKKLAGRNDECKN